MADADELVAEYDSSGEVVGPVWRSRMRAEGRWHAAGSVLLRSGDGTRVYVHRRSDGKDVFPGLLDCWAGGVVAAGESPAECARRELAEELGVRRVAIEPLFRFAYDVEPVRFHFFAFEARWDGPITHQPSEVVDGEWITLAALRGRVADPDWPLVPDGRAAIKRWFASFAESAG